MIVCVTLLFSFISVVVSDDSAKLRYYFSTIDDYKEFPISEAQNIFSTSWYKPDRTTVIFAHGFSGFPTGPAVIAVLSSYLEQGKNNVALLNWDQMAAPVLPSMFNSYINYAVPNTRKLGVDFADTLLNLSMSGLDLNNTHLIGHSLGAHVFGIAGNKLLEKDIQLPWITGLDPATVSFENRPLSARLHAGSARFVAVIHSDPSRYGFKQSLGTVDFWPNYRRPGSVAQPGCDNRPHPTFSPGDLCNHNRCWELLIDALKHPGTLIGSHAENYRKWRRYTDEERKLNVLEIGVYKENVLPGNYYLTTKAESPYGLGDAGL